MKGFDQNMWVFGYGSLIWKADFPFERKVVGHIKGYIRRFYQKSTDHRGKPSYPGRVVTLLESEKPDNEVWGCAYQVASENIESVCRHLDHRERGGYIRKDVLFYPQNTDLKPFYLTLYIAEEHNPNFAGYEDNNTIARFIANAAGISGHNMEYLYNLAASMRTIAPNVYDEHLFELENTVKKLEISREKLVTEMQRLRNSNTLAN